MPHLTDNTKELEKYYLSIKNALRNIIFVDYSFIQGFNLACWNSLTFWEIEALFFIVVHVQQTRPMITRTNFFIFLSNTLNVLYVIKNKKT